MIPSISEPVLVYTRIADNRRKTWWLVAFAILSIVPFVLSVSYGISTLLMSQVSGRAHERRVRWIEMENALADANATFAGTEFAEQMRLKAKRLKEQDAREAAVDRSIELQIMGAIAVGSTAVLGLLFWGIAASPTSKVLALSGARPADAQEAEAKRLLENLSIGAGLHPPKLYVIESSSPNAFAAGTDPAHSVVVVTRGLLTLMDTRELEGVLAHELSHIANHDTRLNTIVASIALFLRLPYLLRQRQIREGGGAEGMNPLYRRFQMYRLLMSPLYIYIFFVAPAMASVIRSAISRNREYLADADAALLTRYPEGLMRALAKVRGAGSALTAANPVISHFYFSDPAPSGFKSGIFGGNLLATHPPLDQRIIKLMEFNGGVPATAVEAAVKAGQQFTKDHPAMAENDFASVSASDELAVLTVGNPMGQVFRVMGLATPVPVLERPDSRSPTIARISDGELIVAFDDPGKYRQILTANQTFGYIPYSVKLQKTDMFPNELFGMKTEASTSTQVAAEAYSGGGPAPTFVAAVLPTDARASGLTAAQIAIAAAFFVGVFALMFFALTQFSK